eukprot:798686-Pelagomonas_calceolata.AAC.1
MAASWKPRITPHHLSAQASTNLTKRATTPHHKYTCTSNPMAVAQLTQSTEQNWLASLLHSNRATQT